jgi:uncharacterized protein DUF4124
MREMMMRRWLTLRCLAVAGVAAAVLGWLAPSAANAQKFYRWTDARGVVHFSDSSPPAGTENVETRDLPVEPAARGEAAPEGESAEAPPEAAAGTPASGTPGAVGTPSAKLTGDARVRVTDQKQNRDGDSSYTFTGSVKNAGGKTAENVVVVITVTEPNQGAECVNEEVSVHPSNLKPGEQGKYSVHIENPCFFGPIDAQVKPDWG